MKPTNSAWIKIVVGLWIPVIILVAGCGPSQQEMMAKDQLERARSAYTQAKADRNVEAFAPMAFADAGKTLQAAEQAKNPEEKAQLAYLAEKRERRREDGRKGCGEDGPGNLRHDCRETDPGGENRHEAG